jgi:hypothetical protein
MKRKLLSLLVLLMTAATGAWAETITWDDSNVFNRENKGVIITQADIQGSAVTSTSASATYEGITISCDRSEEGSQFMLHDGYTGGRFIVAGESGDSFTFTAPTGKIFTKIEIYGYVGTFTPYGDWTQPSEIQIAWSGTAANAVTLGTVNTSLMSVRSIVFYVEEPLPLTLSEATDNSTALSTANGKVCDVTLTRTLQTGGYNTFAVPFNISSAKMTELGITAKKLTASDFNSTTGTLTLTFSSASEIEAGKPYLVKVSANVANPTFSGVTVSSTAVPNTETAAVNFVPTLGKALVTGDGSYASEPGSVLFLGSGNKLFSPTVVNNAGQEASYMKGFRAYFQLKGTAASARAFNIDFGDGETTGIISVNGSGLMVNGSDSCYDLLGRRIEGQPTQKGVYIVNGKKTVIK